MKTLCFARFYCLQEKMKNLRVGNVGWFVALIEHVPKWTKLTKVMDQFSYEILKP
jgi:hypothetical protein